MGNEGIHSRKERAIETKKKLYDTAERLFAKFGIDEVSVDAIVEEAKVSKGTFYVHFDSKDTLIALLVSDYVNRIDLDYERYLAEISSDTSSTDVLLSLVGKIFEVIVGHIGLAKIKILYKLQLNGAGYAQVAASYNRVLYDLLAGVLERGIQRGEFKASLPAGELARHLILAMRGLTYEWCIRYPDFDLQEQANAHFKILLAGIKSGMDG